MKNQQQEFESRKAAVAKLIEEQLKEGSLGTTLSDIAFAANKYGLRLSRQNLHNWLHQVYLPSTWVLRPYILTLQEKAEGPESEAGLLLAFFQKLWEASGYE
jgi:hypothetical protein